MAAISVRVLVELGVANPVPALNAPAVPQQLQHCFWGGAQAGEEQALRLKGLAVAAAGGRLLHDPAGADPGLGDVHRHLFGTQCPGDGATLADLVIRRHERDLALSLELAADLAVQPLLVGLDRQQEVGSLLLELTKNGCWICRGFAWISTPSRSSSSRSYRSTARSWFSQGA